MPLLLTVLAMSMMRVVVGVVIGKLHVVVVVACRSEQETLSLNNFDKSIEIARI